MKLPRQGRAESDARSKSKACPRLGATAPIIVGDPGSATSPACWKSPENIRDVHHHKHHQGLVRETPLRISGRVLVAKTRMVPELLNHTVLPSGDVMSCLTCTSLMKDRWPILESTPMASTLQFLSSNSSESLLNMPNSVQTTGSLLRG